MRTFSKIIARFLLGMFCLFMLHQFAPHSHHQHEVEVLSDHHSEGHSASSHQHQSDDHHRSSHEHHPTKKSPLDLLSLLFANHSHSQQLVDNFPSQEQTSEVKENKKEVQKTLPESFRLEIVESSPPRVKAVPNFLGTHKSPYYISLSLRGPPTLE